MVEKVVVRMGCLVEREEEEGGVVVVFEKSPRGG